MQTRQVLHQPPSLFHRDIRWPNVVRQADDLSLWFLIDWDDAAGPNTVAASHLSTNNHSPNVFVDGHGGEVDIWGVGMLIIESAKFVFNISSDLITLGRWMQEVEPTSKTALDAIMTYQSKAKI